MPIYPLKNTETEEIFEKSMKIAEYELYMQENPHIQRYYEMGNFAKVADPTRLMDCASSKPPSDFQKGIIQRIAHSIPGNRINDIAKYQTPREW